MQNPFKTPSADSSQCPVLRVSEVLGLLSLFALVIFCHWYKSAYLAPAPENIWDNVYLWDWARSVSLGDFSAFVPDSHHQMRWGNWLFASILINFWGDGVINYYLATIIPSTLGALVFVYVVHRHLGFVAAFLFIVLWQVDALLFRATFQLLPSGAAILPLGIAFAMCVNILKTHSLSRLHLVILSLVVVWLYGTKETHLAYLPAILLIVLRVGGIRAVGSLAAIFCAAYVVETLAFKSMSGAFSWFGRVYAIVNGGQHVALMTEHAGYVAGQTRYFDAGITMRWVATSGVTAIPIFFAFTFALFCRAKAVQVSIGADKKAPLLEALSLFVISFIVCNTFFIISLDPIRLGQPLVPRYVTTLLPLAYMMCIAYAAMMATGSSRLLKFGLIAIIPFFIAPSIDRISKYRDIGIQRIANSYDAFGAELIEYECVRNAQKVILMNQLDLVPMRYRDERLNLLITKDDHVVQEPPFYVAKTDPAKECQSVYTIGRGHTMRY